MRVLEVPCLQDNYAYLLIDEPSRQAAIIDPSEAPPVLEALQREGIHPIAVLCTHHHHDHVGGLAELSARYPQMPIYGHEYDKKRLPALTHLVKHGDQVPVGPFALRALHVPGHTMGAVAWVTGPLAFTGDTLFVGGCGRLFEGTAQMMHKSLNQVLGSLPAETQIYCGHEYTESNLRFAQHVEPQNQALLQKIEQVKALRQKGRPTIPSTLAEEKQTNPFLRCEQPQVIAFAKEQGLAELDPVSVLGLLRTSKNNFKA